jgi:hypothetical protein
LLALAGRRWRLGAARRKGAAGGRATARETAATGTGARPATSGTRGRTAAAASTTAPARLGLGIERRRQQAGQREAARLFRKGSVPIER